MSCKVSTDSESGTILKDLQRPVDVIRYRNKMNPYLKARIDREARYA